MGTYSLNNTDVNPEAFRLRAGTEINRYLAVAKRKRVWEQPVTLTWLHM